MTTKTIQRDIDFMRDRLSLPIAHNDEKRGCEFTQPVECFPLVEASEAELISGFIAQKALMPYKGMPFEHPLWTAFEELFSSLDSKITLSWDDLQFVASSKSRENS